MYGVALKFLLISSGLIGTFISVGCSEKTIPQVQTQKESDLPKVIVLKWKDKFSIVMVRIEPATFRMGRSKHIFDNLPFNESSDPYSYPAFKATITGGFYIGKDNINCGQFVEFLKEVGPANVERYVNAKKDYKWKQFDIEADSITMNGKADDPVKSVHWAGATAYCAWLADSSKMKFRLPTEAEWELTARGPNNSYDSTWEFGNIGYPKNPTPPNGVRGLATGSLGNWVSDYFGLFDKSSKTDPAGPTHENAGIKGTFLRGGLSNDYHVLRASHRAITCRSPGDNAEDSAGVYGFRVVLEEESVREFLEHPEDFPEGITIAHFKGAKKGS